MVVGTPETVEKPVPSTMPDVEFHPALPIGEKDERVCVMTFGNVVVLVRVVVNVRVES